MRNVIAAGVKGDSSPAPVVYFKEIMPMIVEFRVDIQISQKRDEIQ